MCHSGLALLFVFLKLVLFGLQTKKHTEFLLPICKINTPSALL